MSCASQVEADKQAAHEAWKQQVASQKSAEVDSFIRAIKIVQAKTDSAIRVNIELQEQIIKANKRLDAAEQKTLKALQEYVKAKQQNQ